MRGIDVEIVYKDIKHLHIGVYPPDGRVRVAAPGRLGDSDVHLAVVHRLPWIKRQRQLLADAVRQSEREMVTGESHYVWGRRHRLRVIERPGRAHVEVDGDRLLLYMPVGTDITMRTAVLQQWQRDQLRERLPDLIARWESVVGRTVAEWRIKRMKTRWGSCNPAASRLWFNLELAKKHPDCLEYVVVHEMTHLRERGHGKRFTALMDEFLPDWRSRRDQLNTAPLAEEHWP